MINKVKYALIAALAAGLGCDSEQQTAMSKPPGQALPAIESTKPLVEDPRLVGRALLQQKRYVDALAAYEQARKHDQMGYLYPLVNQLL